jgi:carboxyl-terminal processing protease
MKNNISQKNIVLIIALCFFTFTLGYSLKNNTVSSELMIKENFDEKDFGEEFDFSLFNQVWRIIEQDYVQQPIVKKDLFYGSLEGLVKGLGDDYSSFLKPDLAKRFLDDVSGSFEGVGIEIGIKDERLTVIAPLDNTPAFRAGLRSGDKIYAINGESTLGISLDEAADLIRGEKGTQVVLTIFRELEEEVLDVEITRDTIDIKSVSWELMGPEDKIAYIKITHFSDDTWGDFQNIAQVVLGANPRGLILDLRNNPGGYLDTAVDIAGYWVSRDIIVLARDSEDREREYKSSGPGYFQGLPTVVLVNQGSASASEILAGALQDYQMATILGEQTFGKGSVQELRNLSDGSALKLTIANWYTPLGRTFNKEGIVPDTEVKMTKEDYLEEKDPQMEKAIEILSN